ncbi:MAG: hypothetical protein HRU29_01125 [Rhizobiales bacterium]|nr:hypothetical protein [Hyphomicrobiales bacterium]NRB12974.1 hypothetical protein [Hyphomicrobiales bacterium]
MNSAKKNDDGNRIYTKLKEDDYAHKRRCHKCDGQMDALRRSAETVSVPWKDKGIDFKCTNCDEVVYIANSDSVITSFVAAIVVVGGIFYLLATGLLDFILYSFNEFSVWILFGIFLIAVILAFLYGVWVNLKSTLELVVQKRQNPQINIKPLSKRQGHSLALGLAPWLLAVGFGYLNDRLQILDKNTVFLVLPIIFSPLLLAPKLNTTIFRAFLGCIFWLILGFLVYITVTN